MSVGKHVCMYVCTLCMYVGRWYTDEMKDTKQVQEVKD